jgi:hypothetical protein
VSLKINKIKYRLQDGEQNQTGKTRIRSLALENQARIRFLRPKNMSWQRCAVHQRKNTSHSVVGIAEQARRQTVVSAAEKKTRRFLGFEQLVSLRQSVTCDKSKLIVFELSKKLPNLKQAATRKDIRRMACTWFQVFRRLHTANLDELVSGLP